MGLEDRLLIALSVSTTRYICIMILRFSFSLYIRRQHTKVRVVQAKADTKARQGITTGDGLNCSDGRLSIGLVQQELRERGPHAYRVQVREEALAGVKSEEERAEITGHWPWDDMDEERYMLLC